jgi:succinyl-diaminopimelate desuccinylase
MDKVELLKKLIACKAVTDNLPAVNLAIDVMHNFLVSNGLFCTIEDASGRHILYASTEQTKAPDFLLNAHLDVVPANDEQFIPRIENGIMFARGTGDCQGNAVVLADLLLRVKGKASVGVIFSTDEEDGGLTTEYMVRHGYTAKKMIIVADGNPYSIAIAQKGIIDCTLVANSKGGHSSAPWDFKNPIDMLIDGYIKLRDAWPKSSASNQWVDTMAPTILSGGAVHNQIPDSAQMHINIRYINPTDCEEIIKKIEEITGLEVIISSICSPFFADENDPMVVALKKAMQDMYPEKNITLIRMNGATDARHFAKLSAPIAVIGIDGDGIHTSNESLRLASLDENADLLEQFILSV